MQELSCIDDGSCALGSRVCAGAPVRDGLLMSRSGPPSEDRPDPISQSHSETSPPSSGLVQFQFLTIIAKISLNDSFSAPGSASGSSFEVQAVTPWVSSWAITSMKRAKVW